MSSHSLFQKAAACIRGLDSLTREDKDMSAANDERHMPTIAAGAKRNRFFIEWRRAVFVQNRKKVCAHDDFQTVYHSWLLHRRLLRFVLALSRAEPHFLPLIWSLRPGIAEKPQVLQLAPYGFSCAENNFGD
jgi:hypothetical protein